MAFCQSESVSIGAIAPSVPAMSQFNPDSSSLVQVPKFHSQGTWPPVSCTSCMTIWRLEFCLHGNFSSCK